MKKETLELSRANAFNLYKLGNKDTKEALEGLYGKDYFKHTLITSFEEALAMAGLKESDVFSKTDSKDEIAYKKLKLIRSCLVGSWRPDWNNSDEYKYWPVFDMRSKSGFGFSHASYAIWTTHAGSRLCFPTSELAEYAGKTFGAEYQDYITEQ